MSVINEDSSVFQANAIFLQPTWACAKNCHGCYVKEKEHKFLSQQMNRKYWKYLIEDIVRYRTMIQTSQVTLALDALPAYDDLEDEWSIRNIMHAIANVFIYNVSYCKSFDIECHITTNHINDLRKYNFSGINNLDLLSISNILSVEHVEAAKGWAPGAKINWNVTSGDFINQVKRQGLDEVKAILRKVDSVYMLLHKAPMGMQGSAISDFFQAVQLVQQLKEPVGITDGDACLAPSLLSKFHMDGCMNDSVQFLKTGFGCSANVSRFQIWPDGRVTGCAYNSQHQYGEQAFITSDVMKNLKAAKERYEFSGRNAGKPCMIPDELKEYSNKKHLQVTT